MVIEAGLRAIVGKPVYDESENYVSGYVWKPFYDEIAKWMRDNRYEYTDKGGNPVFASNCKGLLLIGANGTGKTTIEKILRRVFDRYFGTENDTVNKCSFVSASNVADAWNKYSRYQIIDDIGKEPVSNSFGEKHDYFSQIVDRAEQMGQLLVCSANLTPKELMDKYGARTMDRMNHILHPVKFDGESMRR